MFSREKSRWEALAFPESFVLKDLISNSNKNSSTNAVKADSLPLPITSQVKLCPAHEESRITESKEKTMFLTLVISSDAVVDQERYIVCRCLQHVADFVAGCKKFGDVTEV